MYKYLSALRSVGKMTMQHYYDKTTKGVALKGEGMISEYKTLVGIPRENITARPNHRWEDNIKIDLNGTGCSWVNRTKVVLDTVQLYAL
jgi:hypothetical protein